MARVNWQGTEIEASLIDQLPNGNYRMRSQGHAHRVEPGTVIEVKQSEIVGLNIGGRNFNGPGAAAQVAGQASGQTFTSVPPQGPAASNPMPTGGQQAAGQMPAAANDREPQTITAADVGPLPAAILAPAPQPQGKTMGTPLVEIKGLGNAITSVRSGLAGVRALAADVQVSAGALHAELTDIKGQIEDARTQIKTEASIMGNGSGG